MVRSVAYSPDGRYIASGSRDKTVRIWDASTGEEVTKLLFSSAGGSVKFSPNGQELAVGQGHILELRDLTHPANQGLNPGPRGFVEIRVHPGFYAEDQTDVHAGPAHVLHFSISSGSERGVGRFRVPSGSTQTLSFDLTTYSDLTNEEAANSDIVFLFGDSSTATATFQSASRLRLKDGRGSITITIGNTPGTLDLKAELFPARGDCSSLASEPGLEVAPNPIVPVTEQKQIASEGSVTISEPVSYTNYIIAKNDRHSLEWTLEDTYADDSESLVLTVEFLNGSEKNKNDVIAGAREWSKHGNVLFKFVDSGPSDVRIVFDRDMVRDENQKLRLAKNKWYVNFVGTEGVRHYGTSRYHANNQATMHLSTDYDRHVILHEFGHILGLNHEHLSPQFAEYFEWTPSEEGIYNDIRRAYRGYKDPDPNESEADRIAIEKRIDHNILQVRPADPRSKFDPKSVMTYGIPGSLITGRVDNPPWVKELADGKGIPNSSDGKGISQNNELSERDKEFIAKIYGDALPRADIEIEITVEGLDDESWKFWKKDEKYTGSKTVSRLLIHQEEFGSSNIPIAVFKWGGEVRVELFLCSRGVIDARSDYAEIGLLGLLYEGTSERSNDLEDLEARIFNLSLDNRTKTRTIYLENTWGDRSISGRAISDLNALNVSYDQDGLPGDLLGGGDWAEITVSLKGSLIKPEDVDPDLRVLAAPSAAVVHRFLDADINNDGQVDASDLILVSDNLGGTGFTNQRLDVNNDKAVTIVDLMHVARYLGKSKHSSAPTTVVIPTGLKYETVQGWIAHARVENDGSSIFKQGIAKLEQLLTLFIPEKMALLPNYPNPFNPETWIPYHLSTPASVIISIYAIDGKIVRRLELGHQPAGFYQEKSRAAHWDGRNNIGERVASGIYFYTLEAGDFTATRKMLIIK